MPHPLDSHAIGNIEQLASLFGPVGNASIKKEVGFVHPHYRALIEASPFAVLATHGPDGLDASPRGDAPGFVVVEDETTLLIPERRGNNRVDNLRNIISDPRVALLFLIPGIGETLRVSGRAIITTAPSLLQRFAIEGSVPKCVIVVQRACSSSAPARSIAPGFGRRPWPTRRAACRRWARCWPRSPTRRSMARSTIVNCLRVSARRCTERWHGAGRDEDVPTPSSV
jgi:PPOX class probable FMN-dependent enzyme